MSLPSFLASTALQVSRAIGAGYWNALARWPGTPVVDDGGSIVSPGSSLSLACHVQIDSADETMRAEAGYTDGDVAALVLVATLDGALDTDARLVVLEGPHAGTYSVQSVRKDAAGSHWRCRARLSNAA